MLNPVTSGVGSAMMSTAFAVGGVAVSGMANAGGMAAPVPGPILLPTPPPVEDSFTIVAEKPAVDPACSGLAAQMRIWQSVGKAIAGLAGQMMAVSPEGHPATVVLVPNRPGTTAEEVKHPQGFAPLQEPAKRAERRIIMPSVTEREDALSKKMGMQVYVVRYLNELGNALRERDGDLVRGRVRCEGKFVVVLLPDGSEELRIVPKINAKASSMVLDGELVVGAGAIHYHEASRSIQYNGSGSDIETLGNEIFVHPKNIRPAAISGLRKVKEVFRRIFGDEAYLFEY